jgi:hypothetical protein
MEHLIDIFINKTRKSNLLTAEEVKALDNYDEILRTSELVKNLPEDAWQQSIKFELSMIHLGGQKAYQLFQTDPNLPLNKVVGSILDNFEQTLNASLTLKVTQKIIETWEKLTEKSLISIELAEAA